jgi:hypothetical protein
LDPSLRRWYHPRRAASWTAPWTQISTSGIVEGLNSKVKLTLKRAFAFCWAAYTKGRHQLSVTFLPFPKNFLDSDHERDDADNDELGYWGATEQKSSIRKMSSDFLEGVECVRKWVLET